MNKNPARCIAFLGTGSDVGKSVLVTAICRIFKNQGWKVAPYKAQNMSNNSYVTREGGEMGRAQVVQAEACGIEPHTDMNPVLLKPNTDIGSQVVLNGQVMGNAQAADYFRNTTDLREAAFATLQRLREKVDLVVIEGAGSCGEVNLRSRDFVNFETAHACGAPVILIADIDKGGVFAQIIGTLNVIPERDRKRVAGFIINKFRGDASLFEDGRRYLEAETGLPMLGLIPYFRHIEIDSEDGMPLDTVLDPASGPIPGKINIAVLRLPHISNFTDFNPLIRHPAVSLHYLSKTRTLAGYDAVILPGTKNVRFDLEWLRQQHWDQKLNAYVENSGQLIGICGGFQMLGRRIRDPEGLEGEPGESEGFGWLKVDTLLEARKCLSRTQGQHCESKCDVDGYEIHMGRSTVDPTLAPFVQLHSRNRKTCNEQDGAVSENGKIWGSYLHGLFDSPSYRNHFLHGLNPGLCEEDSENTAAFKERQYDLLADHVATHLDLNQLKAILQDQ